ncbi:hypothetical protein GGU11DRAFT_857020, partial [Lentinula aff. detonsa]
MAAGIRMRDYKSQAERMSKEQRKQVGIKRITAYCHNQFQPPSFLLLNSGLPPQCTLIALSRVRTP